MKKSKALRRTAIAYFASILIFWVAYYAFYVTNTSNFIINAELNEQTISPTVNLQDISTKNTGEETSADEVSTIDQRKLLMPKIDSLQNLKVQERSVERLIMVREKLSDTLFKAVFKTHDRNIAALLQQRTAGHQRSIDSLNKLLVFETEQQPYLTPNSAAYDQLMVRISKLNVEKANQDYAIQLIKLKVYDDGLTHMTDYYDKALYQKFNDLAGLITQDRNHKSELLNHIDTLSERIYGLNLKYHIARVSRVSPIDFLYFSIITATTTGYGDILPNTSLIRMLVSAEVLINMFLFGLFFYYLAVPPPMPNE